MLGVRHQSRSVFAPSILAGRLRPVACSKGPPSAVVISTCSSLLWRRGRVFSESTFMLLNLGVGECGAIAIRVRQLAGRRYVDRIQRWGDLMNGCRVGQKRECNWPRKDFSDSELTTWDGIAGRRLVPRLISVSWDSVAEIVLHRTEKEKPRYLLDSGVSFTDLVPER